MKTPREIIAENLGRPVWTEAINQADAILASLTASGYRIVPSGRDPDTIADQVRGNYAAAIRTMGGGE